MTPDVVAVPCLADNYAWYVPALGVVVDPSEAAPVLAALDGRPLRAVWCTHHHWDHVGGVAELTARFPGLEVVGSRYDGDRARIPHQTRAVGQGDDVDGARVIEVPGHTMGAVAYVLGDAVFTGDTLFLAGCGRLFEGDAATMVASLGKLRALPPETRVYCGHEYTARNLAFVRSVDPTVAREPAPPPGTVAEERATNPFLRWDDPALAERMGTAPGVALFAALRAAKDGF